MWYINIESDLKGVASNLFSYTHVVRVGVTEQFWVRVGWVVDVKGVPQVVH